MTPNIRNINNATDRIVIVCYPGGSGGKFLMNCLALSQHAVLQDADLARAQIAGQLDVVGKYELLQKRLRAAEHGWNDLGMGCHQLFNDVNYTNKPILHTRFFHFHPVIHDLSWDNNYFFLAAHSAMQLRGQLKIWYNAKVVCFYNTHEFLQQYRSRYLHAFMTTWCRIKGKSWPDMPPDSLDQYWQLSDAVRQELKDMGVDQKLQSVLLWQHDQQDLEHQNQQIFSQLRQTHRWHAWDCDQYLDRDRFHLGIAGLYKDLELDDFDPDLTMGFYDAWISRLRALHSIKVR